MKKVIYKSLYELLSAITGKINNRYINHCKIAVGTTLLLLTSGCQTAKKNNKNEGSKDTVYADTIPSAEDNPDIILCYETIEPIGDSVTVQADTLETITDDKLVVTCYTMPPVIEDPDSIGPNHIYMIVNEMPEFPGGIKELMKFIEKHIYFPEGYEDTSTDKRVIVQFVVEKDGSITDPQIVYSKDSKLNEIALEVVSKFPAFKPGVQYEEPVRVQYTVPIRFKRTSK